MKLHAETLDQLSPIAAMLQDALVPPGDISFLEEEGSFAMALNRFRWETAEQKDVPYERILTGLRFDTVTRAQFRGIDRRAAGSFLSFLTIAFDEDHVVLHFGGDGVIRLDIERLLCTMEDLSEPWPTHMKPVHDPN